VISGAQNRYPRFTNGDPPLALPLVDPANGLYSGTWTPRKAVSNLTIKRPHQQRRRFSRI